jgi:hypothetical protein
MGENSFWTNLVLFIIVLHFIVGIGYLIYMLSPRKEDKNKE